MTEASNVRFSAALYKKHYSQPRRRQSDRFRQLRVVINQKSGGIHAFAKLLVAEKVVDKREEISLVDARRIKQQVAIGEEVEVDVTPAGFGRVAARFAKQALMDQIRRAEEGL